MQHIAAQPTGVTTARVHEPPPVPLRAEHPNNVENSPFRAPGTVRSRRNLLEVWVVMRRVTAGPRRCRGAVRVLAFAVLAALGAACMCSAASANLYLWPDATLHGTAIDHEVSQLRPRALDLDGDGHSDLAITNASCISFPCPTGSAYSIVYPAIVDSAGGVPPMQGILAGSYSDVQDVGAANVTGDAHPDLVLASPGSHCEPPSGWRAQRACFDWDRSRPA